MPLLPFQKGVENVHKAGMKADFIFLKWNSACGGGNWRNLENGTQCLECIKLESEIGRLVHIRDIQNKLSDSLDKDENRKFRIQRVSDSPNLDSNAGDENDKCSVAESAIAKNVKFLSNVAALLATGVRTIVTPPLPLYRVGYHQRIHYNIFLISDEEEIIVDDTPASFFQYEKFKEQA